MPARPRAPSDRGRRERGEPADTLPTSMTSGPQPVAEPPSWTTRPWVAMFETALIVGGLFVLFFLLPHGLFGDDLVRFDDLEQLLHSGHLTKSHYSLTMPISSVPVLSLGKLVESRTWWAARFNVIVVADRGARRVPAASRADRSAALPARPARPLLFASFLTNRLRDYSPEVLTATLVSLGIICVATDRHVLAGWSAIVIGVVNTRRGARRAHAPGRLRDGQDEERFATSRRSSPRRR